MTKCSEFPMTVALIGCGPGGMFFLHALAAKKKKLAEEGDLDAIARLPKVTCFERASLPGGVWRAERDDKTSTTNMYDGLWINSAKESFEFFDYSFDEHFKSPQPAFLPRKDCFEYILGRVTQHEDIFQHVRFDTNVEAVTFDENAQKFSVTTSCNDTCSIALFDKCIWAGGVNGKPKMIHSILDDLEGFNGEILHSSEMNRLETMISSKRILMIGGNYSAEDLALQCTKLGSGKIYITSRCNEGVVSTMGSWPKDNVDVLEYRVPCGVRDGSTILCRTTYYDDDDRESSEDSDDDSYNEPDTVEVKDVDVIVFCTGYTPNADFLDPSLNAFLGEKEVSTWKLPKDWRMKPNVLTKALGHVKPSKKLRGYGNDIYTGEGRLYDVLLMSNPSMMFIVEGNIDVPLLETDVKAYGCMRYLTGDLVVPSEDEMQKSYREKLELEMNSIESRREMDVNYEEAIWERLQKEHWYLQYVKHQKLSDESANYILSYFREMMSDFSYTTSRYSYPMSIGDSEKLNEMGESLAQFDYKSSMSRYDLVEFVGNEVAEWMTYRDLLKGQKSMFTGTVAIPLKGKWMDLDDEGNARIGEDVLEEKKEQNW